MPSMSWRLSDWLGVCKKGIRHRRRPLSRREPAASAERMEGRTLLTGVSTVSGVAFIDADTDGANDPGEVTVRGIAVTLSGTSDASETVNATATTDADGTFTFIRVPAGTYTLTALPGTQLTGSTVTINNVVVGATGEVNRNIALGGLKPALVSLRQYRNTSTNETLPFATAGTGRAAASNDAPTVLPTADLDLAPITASATPTTTNIDLAGIFTDANLENSEIRFRTSAGNINVELFDDEAPITVANFYEYINAGRYNDTIFHRLDDNFIIQGGGFSFNDTANTFPAITTDPAIVNEPDFTNRPNVANTIAMAKTSDPNSATGQFFFNLADNSSSLNNVGNSGGFTVFGEIVDSTSTTDPTNSVLLDLEDTPVSNRSSTNSALGELPLNNYTGTNFPTDLTPANLLRIIGVDTVRRDESLSYTLVSNSNATLLTASVVNHRLRIVPIASQSGQADIVIRATDQFGDSVTASFRVHIQPVGNTAPTATVGLSPAQPLVTSTLTATATRADTQSHPVNLTYVWKNGSVVLKTTTASTSLTDTLDLTTVAAQVAAGDTIRVEVTPNDGFVDGNTVSTTRVIDNSNTAPTATVGLSPEDPTVTSIVTATATAADVNGQAVLLTYEWKVGTTVVQTTGPTANLTDTLDLAGETVVKGDTVTVEVTPTDGTTPGTAASDSVTVANSTPVATVSLGVSNPTVNSVVTATATATDADNDVVSLTYVWKIGGVEVRNSGPITDLTDQFDLSTTALDVADATLTVEVTPNDGTIDGALVSDSTTILSET